MGDSSTELHRLESTVSLQLNGFIAKLETALLSGEVDVDILDGVSVAIEANAMNVGTDGGEIETDLLSISVKLVGDVGHWLGADKNLTLTLDGRVTIALGGKLLQKLGTYAIARLEQQLLARQLGALGTVVDAHWKKVDALEKQLAQLDPTARAARDKLKQEILEQRLKISTAAQELKRVEGKLAETAKRAKQFLGKVQGKVAKAVAKAMEKKAVKFVAEKLAKLIPILNAISTIKDIVELALLFKRLLKGEYGGNGGDGDGDGDGSTTDAAPPVTSPSEAAPTSSQPGEVNARDPNAPEGSNPAAKAVLDAVTRHGDAGPQLDETQRQLLHASIPRDLTPQQISEVIELLRRDGEKARSTSDIVVAIDLAVRAVRNRSRTVTVNGQRQEASAAPAKPDGPVTSPSQLDGPVTSPRDVDRSQGSSGATTPRGTPKTGQ